MELIKLYYFVKNNFFLNNIFFSKIMFNFFLIVKYKLFNFHNISYTIFSPYLLN